MKHIELFKDGFDSTVQEKIQPENWPYIGHDIVSGEMVYTLVPEPVADDPYVTFTAEEAGSTIGLNKLSTNQTLEYSTDSTTWETFNTETNISLNNKDRVYVRGILSADNTISDYTQFTMSGKIAASGNCNALWYYQDLNAPLKAYCGCKMFYGCKSLTTAPELPATTLTEYCYTNMFYECTSLNTAPELPATKLTNYCYSSMFHGCTSLTTVPEILPATTLAEGCYYYMFYKCNSLTTAPVLPATTLANSCYHTMFEYCTSLTAAPELRATVLAKSCYKRMFRYCYSITITPKLPAMVLTDSCYSEMFRNCTSFNHITCLATDISASNCTKDWVRRVSSTGTFVKHPDMNGWSAGTSGIPSGWTVVDAEV